MNINVNSISKQNLLSNLYLCSFESSGDFSELSDLNDFNQIYIQHEKWQRRKKSDKADNSLINHPSYLV